MDCLSSRLNFFNKLKLNPTFFQNNLSFLAFYLHFKIFFSTFAVVNSEEGCFCEEGTLYNVFFVGPVADILWIPA